MNHYLMRQINVRGVEVNVSYVKELRTIVGHRPLILVGSVAIVVDKVGRLLLQQRKFPRGVWGIPGGLMELGESTEEVAQRELYEETQLNIRNLQLINVYSGTGSYIEAENGDAYYAVTTAYYTNEFSGKIKIDPEESLDFKFFKPTDLPKQIVGSHRKMLNEFLDNHYSKLIE